MKKPKDLPEKLVWPPKTMHSHYARRGAAATAEAARRRRRLAALEKKP